MKYWLNGRRKAQIIRLLSLIFGVLDLKVSGINGLNVITADACVLGEVDGVNADTDTWQITHLNVVLTKETTRELGLKKPFLGSLTVSLPVTVINEIGDVITLSKSLLELKDIEEFKVEQ